MTGEDRAEAEMASDGLVAEDVTFEYRAGQPVVWCWSAEFPAGAMTALTGPSGTGKSTLLYLLGLMLRPSSGRVLLHGRRVDHLPDRERARLRAGRYGFVFQDAALDTTRAVLDNIVETALYRGDLRREAVQIAYALMERFGVELRATHKPGEISGGQAQRIALCRALLGNPAIILADEPTGNLDAGTSTIVVDALRERAHGGAVVIVATHSAQVVEACDRRIDLDGRK